MDDIIAFVNARLGEDEAAANAAAAEDSADWTVVKSSGTAEHIARHDPARVLREVAAKRVIIELHGWSQPMRILASIYSDHPDYDPAWALGGR